MRLFLFWLFVPYYVWRNRGKKHELNIILFMNKRIWLSLAHMGGREQDFIKEAILYELGCIFWGLRGCF